MCIQLYHFLHCSITHPIYLVVEGVTVERSANLGRRLGDMGTTACVTFPTAALTTGTTFEVNLDSQFGSGAANSTVVV